jgi:hypothetical protein
MSNITVPLSAKLRGVRVAGSLTGFKSVADDPHAASASNKPISVWDSTGVFLGKFNLGSLVINLAAASKACKYVTTYTASFTRADLSEYLTRYKNPRPTSSARVQRLANRRQRGEYVVNYPTLFFDTDGRIQNGGHNVEAALATDGKAFVFVCVLGIDPRMNTRMDVLKARSHTDQGYYVPDLYDGIAEPRAHGTFITSSKYLIGYLTAHCGYTRLTPSEAKDTICDSEAGKALLRAVKPHFLDLRSKLAKLSEPEREQMAQAKFYVPTLLLLMAGKPVYRKWAYYLATGRGYRKKRTMKILRHYCAPAETAWLGHVQRPIRRVGTHATSGMLLSVPARCFMQKQQARPASCPTPFIALS